MEPGLQNILRDRLNLVIIPRTSEMPPRTGLRKSGMGNIYLDRNLIRTQLHLRIYRTGLCIFKLQLLT